MARTAGAAAAVVAQLAHVPLGGLGAREEIGDAVGSLLALLGSLLE